MKKLGLKKLILTTLGLGLIVVAVLIYLEIIKNIKVLDILSNLAIVFSLFFVVSFFMLNDFKRIKNNSYRFLVFLEMIIVLFAIVVGFILPLFDIKFINELGSGSLWLFISLLLYSSINLYGGIRGYKEIKTIPFLFHVAVVATSILIYTNKIVENYINYALIVSLGLVGLYFIYEAFKGKKEGNKNE